MGQGLEIQIGYEEPKRKINRTKSDAAETDA
jgi:hypothetical protein